MHKRFECHRLGYHGIIVSKWGRNWLQSLQNLGTESWKHNLDNLKRTHSVAKNGISLVDVVNFGPSASNEIGLLCIYLRGEIFEQCNA